MSKWEGGEEWGRREEENTGEKRYKVRNGRGMGGEREGEEWGRKREKRGGGGGGKEKKVEVWMWRKKESGIWTTVRLGCGMRRAVQSGLRWGRRRGCGRYDVLGWCLNGDVYVSSGWFWSRRGRTCE